MMTYKDIKDIPIYFDDMFQEFFTLNDFIKCIENDLKEQKKFERTIYDILKQQDFDDEVIANLFNLSTTSMLELTIQLLKEEL